jgi:hypothetical protein
VPDVDQRRQRHHLALLRTHVEALDVVRPLAVFGFGGHQDLPGAAVLVEVVHVVGAESGRQRRENLVDRHAGFLRLLAVDVDEELRHGGAPQGLRAAKLRVAVGACEKLLQDLLQALGTAVAAVLDEELVAAGGCRGRRSPAD